jgi:hypothetical protein
MEISHIIVGGLSVISVGLLVWVEIKSRRNAAARREAAVAAEVEEPEQSTMSRERRRPDVHVRS